MTTRETVERYFDHLARRKDWEASFADDVRFTSYTSPVKELQGKAGYLQATKRFYSMIRSVEVREVVTDGDRACARTHYTLQPPNGGPEFTSDVAEWFTVRDGAIASLEIYFDSAPFPK
jgi:ketosteroid isomerase-like protein